MDEEAQREQDTPHPLMSNKELYTIIAVLLIWFWGTVFTIVWNYV